MITQKCVNLEKKIAEYRDLKTLFDMGVALETRLNELQKIKNTINPLIQTFVLLKKQGIGNVNVNQNIIFLQNEIDEIIESFSSNPKILAETGVFNKIKSETEFFTKELEDELRRNWELYINDKTPNISNELLSLLEKVPDLQAGIRNIKIKLVEIAKIKGNLPVEEDDITRLHNNINNIEKEWENCGAGAVPEKAISFLIEATKKGAPIDLLEDEVINWLKKFNLWESFVIKVKNNGG